MKTCHYCGKEYADSVVVCPVDGQPITNSLEETRKRIATQAAFNARLVSPASLSGKYRIYVRSSNLIFILTEGTANSILNSIHGFLGPFGAVIPLFLWLFSRRKAHEFNRRLEGADPEDLIRENEKNFRLHLSEIRDAIVEPASLFGLSSKQAGRLDLFIRQGERMKLDFESPNELRTALQLLTPLLPSTLRVNVEWDEAKQRFQKNKTHTPA
jgi:hypothetical protein